MSRELRLIKTDDGSASLFVPELNETYHSTHGALSESRHVFIDKGLAHWQHLHPQAEEVCILEVGFGTGLNALLSYQYAKQQRMKIRYISLEPYPVPMQVAQELKYGDMLQEEGMQDAFLQLHAAAWNEEVSIAHNFKLEKRKTTLEEFPPAPTLADVVFFDAFAPSKQPELWSLPLLQVVEEAMRAGAVFTTYCAKGQLKRDLKTVGLTVETLPGAPGKKEMVRAVK